MSRFYRLTTDQRQVPTAWEHACAAPFPAACWLIGGGPSLHQLPCADIAASPVPKFGVNLSGTRLIRPDFWTAYDPSIRFHRSIYLDAGIVKFLPRARAMDLIPETTYKVCEAPQTCFFDRDSQRGYHDLLRGNVTGIVDWADSLVQAIDIAFRLGFRRAYLAGCDLAIRPSQEWITRAAERGVVYRELEPLEGFMQRCRSGGMTDHDCQRYGLGSQYHFDEEKAFAAALRTDSHYFRIVQSLRLCRQTFASAGLELISATPHSRLNDFFEYHPVEMLLDRIRLQIGDPAREPTRGLYTQQAERPSSLAVMRDVQPPREPRPVTAKPPCRCQSAQPTASSIPTTELIVEDEGWQPVAARPFANHYLEPPEVV